MSSASPRDEFLDYVKDPTVGSNHAYIYKVRGEKASGKLNAPGKDGQDAHAHLIAAAELAQTAQKDMD